MSKYIEQCEALWDEFLHRWPLQKLQFMTLQEYTNAGNDDCFVYWLEARTEALGSIWGGSAFKFGVYSRKDKTQKLTKGKLSYSDDYAWYTKYGNSPLSAFSSVLSKIVQVANAASSGDFESIRSVDLGRVFKWKVAFLYQDRNNPQLIPVYSADFLAAYLGQRSKNSIAQLQKSIADKRGNENVFAFAKQVCETAKEILQKSDIIVESGLLTSEQFRRALTSPDVVTEEDLSLLNTWRAMPDTKTTAAELAAAHGFSNYSVINSKLGNLGKRIARFLNINFKSNDGGERSWVELLTDFQKGPGDLVWSMKKSLQQALDDDEDVSADDEKMITAPVDLNTILYGPPGTGKTYTTIEAALNVLDPEFLRLNADKRSALKARYDELAEQGLISFVTFHQSFSYEDFVEGLRATNNEDGQIKYEVVDGVFKSICESALARVTQKVEAPIDVSGRRIWKMSLGNTKGDDSYIYEDCIENNLALLGYGNIIDFTGVKSTDDIVQRFHAAGKPMESDAYAVTAVSIFVLKMRPGDLLIITDGNHKFRAIGEVTGDYQFIERDDHYCQARPVRWLRVYEPSLPYQQLTKKQFSQMTLYMLKAQTVDEDKLRSLFSTADVVTGFGAGKVDAPMAGAAANARVLVIDEINRGNISRIFGELITLVEPSKRIGAAEALEVTLPYSKERFGVPGNVYLIGTMNTADRSLAGLDIALRRRFTFKEMPPRPDLLEGVMVEDVDVGELLSVLNQRIEVLLDRDHCLGHAYFMPLKDDSSLSRLAAIFRNQIIPLLQEYFFEDWQRIQWVLNDHRKAAAADCFLTQPSVDHQRLFGDGVSVNQQNTRWLVNDSAFDRIDSYRGVINAQA